jgi:hypothetical protein
MNRADDSSIVARNVAIGIAILAAVLAAVFFWGRDRWFAPPGADDPAEVVTKSDGTNPGRDAGTGEATDASGAGAATAGTVDAADTLSDEARRWTALVGRPPRWPGPLSSAPDCTEVDESVAALCASVDARHPAFVDLGGSCAVIQEALDELSARPPDLRFELGSHGTMLANVFHLFRVLGRERMDLLREVLREEPGLVEPGAMALYRWVTSRERCATNPGAIGLRPSFEYAGWMFTSLGGQAYLRRRPPAVEALACFYGVAVVDRATSEGLNSHGIDPRPEIERCAGLIRAQPLVFRDRYLTELDAIARRWESR